MSYRDDFLRVTKMLKKYWEDDIQLKVEGSHNASPILAHKLVLAGRSEVFYKMFDSKESLEDSDEMDTFTFPEMKQEELEALVEFIYSNGSALSTPKLKQHVKALYIAADKYKIPHLRDVCRQEMISSLNASNALEVLEISHKIPLDKDLKDAALDFITKNLGTISSLSEFSLFVGRNPDLVVEIMNNISVSNNGL